MSDELPVWVEPLELARKGAILRGTLELASLPRLTDVLREDTGQVQAELRFALDPQRIAYVRVHLSTRVTLLCQRCLKAFQWPLVVDVDLGIVETEALAEHLPPSYDPYVVGREPVALAEMIEDELLLRLPQVARHAEGECRAPEFANPQPVVEERPESPFAVLGGWKKDT